MEHKLSSSKSTNMSNHNQLSILSRVKGTCRTRIYRTVNLREKHAEEMDQGTQGIIGVHEGIEVGTNRSAMQTGSIH